MPLETLEEIRLLSNLETDQDKLLQIILFGQPELDENLKVSSIRQLKERVTHEFNLTPLTDQEIHQYLNFRMREVGYTGPEIIDSRVAKAVGKYSGGLLRRINIIADKILLSAFAEGTHNISLKHVNAAVKDSGFERSIDGSLTDSHKGIYILIAVFCIILLWLFFSGQGRILVDLVKPPEQNQSAVGDNFTVIEPRQSKVKINIVAPPASKLSTQQVNAVEEVKEPEVEKIAQKEEIQPKVSAVEANDLMQKSKLVSVINRKKKNLGDEKVVKSEINQEKLKIIQKSLSILEEPTKIENSAEKINIKPIDVTGFKNSDWLQWKLKQSKLWLSQQANKGVSIQVMMRSKSASDELTKALRAQWPLNVENTHLFEVEMNGNSIYRVFYGGYSSLSVGQKELKELPEKVKSNGPYLHSIYKMKKTLL